MPVKRRDPAQTLTAMNRVEYVLHIGDTSTLAMDMYDEK